MMLAREISTGLDIGTAKVCAVIVERGEQDVPKVIGVGTSPSRGMRKGIVVDLEKTVRAVTDAVEQAEQMAGVEVDSVQVGIAGDHIRSFNSRGVIAVSRPDHEVTDRDVDRVIEAAKAVAIPMDREILHVLPQEFVVDGQDGIKVALGMTGVRLEVEVHIITAASSAAQNVIKAVERAGFGAEQLVLQPLGTSTAVLDTDERELGVALVDIGEGTTDVAIFHDGCIRHSSVIGLGGGNVTNDIAIGLRTPLSKAEEIKLNYAHAMVSEPVSHGTITVQGLGGRKDRSVSEAQLGTIVEARAEELLSLAAREISKTDYADLLGTGVVLTGGTALMEGIVELGEHVFGLPVKIGTPRQIGGLDENVSDPRYAAAAGLALYGLNGGRRAKRNGRGRGNAFGQIWRWAGSFF
jgi:cell division protein FtsA